MTTTVQDPLTTRTRILLASIDRQGRSRKDYGAVDELAQSIAQFGLLQPVVVTPELKLLVGGRRCAAHDLLGWTEIDVIYRHALTTLEVLEVELEENIRRKDINWIEYARSVRRIHILKVQESALVGEQWTQQKTAISLGSTQGQVGMLLQVANELSLDPKSPLLLEPDWYTAYKKLLYMREQEATKILAARSAAIQALVPAQPVPAGGGSLIDSITDLPKPGEQQVAADGKTATLNVANYVQLGKAEDVMRRMPAECVDHIITDPPYAIDMDNLQQSSGVMDVSSTAAEHGVEDNLKLLATFLPLAYNVVRDKGFVVLWCDYDWFDWLIDQASMCGFSAQRWPLTWCKFSGKNEAAGYNFTKTTEIALVLRKGNATLAKTQSTSWKIVKDDPDDRLFDHPFSKPRELWEWVADAVSLPGQTVLDPFAGSGSCPSAMIGIGRKVLACEMVPQHHATLLTSVSKAATRKYSTTKITYVHDQSTSTFPGVRA